MLNLNVDDLLSLIEISPRPQARQLLLGAFQKVAAEAAKIEIPDDYLRCPDCGSVSDQRFWDAGYVRGTLKCPVCHKWHRV